MNKGWYKLFGWLLIIGDIIFVIYNILDGNISLRINDEVAFLGAIGLFILFAGIYFLRVGYEKIEETKLVESSLILILVSLGLVVASLGYVGICMITADAGSAPWCLIALLPAVWGLLILSGISGLLLIIDWIKKIF